MPREALRSAIFEMFATGGVDSAGPELDREVAAAINGPRIRYSTTSEGARVLEEWLEGLGARVSSYHEGDEVSACIVMGTFNRFSRSASTYPGALCLTFMAAVAAMRLKWEGRV